MQRNTKKQFFIRVFLALALIVAIHGTGRAEEESQVSDKGANKYAYLYEKHEGSAGDRHMADLFKRWNAQIDKMRDKHKNSEDGKLGALVIEEDQTWASESLLENCELYNLRLEPCPYIAESFESTDDVCHYGIPVTLEMLSKTKSWKDKRLEDFHFHQVGIKNFSFDDWKFYSVVLDGPFVNCKFNNACFIDSQFENSTFTFEQFQSTWNYHERRFGDIVVYFGSRTDAVSGNDQPLHSLKEWAFKATNISGLRFYNADWSEALLTNAWLSSIGGKMSTRFNADNVTKEQIYETYCYKRKKLCNISFRCKSFSGWDLREQNLTNSEFRGDVSGLDITNAIITGCRFEESLKEEQLYSTMSYQTKNLTGVYFDRVDMSHWNLSGIDFTGACFNECNLSGANLTDSILSECSLANVKNLTLEQIKSTWDYKTGRMHMVTSLPKEFENLLRSDEAEETK